MPAAFQKTVDKSFLETTLKLSLLDESLVITKGSIHEDEHELDKIMQKLDNEALAISLGKCKFAKKQNRMVAF